MELPFGKTKKKQITHKRPTLVLFVTFSLIILVVTTLYYPSIGYPLLFLKYSSNSSPPSLPYSSLDEPLIREPIGTQSSYSSLDEPLNEEESTSMQSSYSSESSQPDSSTQEPQLDTESISIPSSYSSKSLSSSSRQKPRKKSRRKSSRSSSQKSLKKKSKSKPSSYSSKSSWPSPQKTLNENSISKPSSYSSKPPSPPPPRPPPPPPRLSMEAISILRRNELDCDIFIGDWVRNPEAPYYTNVTCSAIQEHQNCMKFGRPDTDYLKWRWKPNECELPIFDPEKFLEIVSGKSLAFVGDSVARNQMQSLICLLSRVETPIDLSQSQNGQFRRFSFTGYNFTVAMFWSPYLVKAKEADPNAPNHGSLFNLYLDEFNEEWTTQIQEFDYVIISGGQWFFRPCFFYEKGRVVGSNYFLKDKVPDLTTYYGYRRAFRTAFRAINSLENYKGTTFLRTYAPSHFENGIWNKGGNCVRTKPFRSNQTNLGGYNLELYMIQMEEFMTAQKEGRKRGLNFRLLDVTPAMLLRPDGHPSKYGHWPNATFSFYNDCVHWCLPGPVDAWNDFLQEMLRTKGMGST